MRQVAARLAAVIPSWLERLSLTLAQRLGDTIRYQHHAVAEFGNGLFATVWALVLWWPANTFGGAKLTLPVDRSGGTSGTAVEVKQPALADYTSAYMERNGDGSITFRAPIVGATTSGSTYTRSELREKTSDGTDEAAWTPEDGGRMQQTVAVLELPQVTMGQARVIIGQIHGPDDEPLRLYFYADGSLRFADDQPVSGSVTLFLLLDAGGRPSKVPLGSSFAYVLELDRTAIRATVQLAGMTFQALSPLLDF